MSGTGHRAARLAGATARVSRRWPRVPFWLQRGSVRESGLALPGAAVSGAATIAALVYEPRLFWPRYPSLAPAFFGWPGWLAALSLIAPLATLIVVGSHRRPAASWWPAMLPVCGLFVLARAAADAAAAGPGEPRQLPLPAAERRGWPRPRLSLTLASSGPFRAGLPWQILLFFSHLGWLCAAAAQLAGSRTVSPAGRFAGFAALHLLAMASAHLMMRHERRRRALLPAGWANRLMPYLLLLPAPANVLFACCGGLPRALQAPGRLAAFAFAAQSPLQRLAAFRSRLPARSGLSPFFQSWTAGDPFAHLAAARRRREQPWIALHRLAFAFQAAAAARWLLPLGATAETWVMRILGLALATAGAAVGLQLALLLAGFTENSAILTRLGRASGFAFALVLGLAAGSVSGAAPPWTVGFWTALLVAAGVAMLVRLPVEILGANEKLERLPPAVTRGLAFAAASFLLQLLRLGAGDDAVAKTLVGVMAGSPLLSPLLVYLAARRSAPPLVAARWLGIPFAAALLPFVRGRR